jgi:hypothetical protein
VTACDFLSDPMCYWLPKAIIIIVVAVFFGFAGTGRP